jgi:tRNA 5-methylaminomethyl-2-thiouridine biosynthesis bifunctional protein
MKGAPRSERFDDVYFSAENGLAETQHVFLAGNNLPQAWAGRERFTVAETGFGTGLNMLTVWRLFKDTAAPGQRLELISIEKYPLKAVQIEGSLTPFAGAFEPELKTLIECYPIDVSPGIHTLPLAQNVTLNLIFADVEAALQRIQTPVDCWFLDGFKPASNPEMWTQHVFDHMARLSPQGATFATFTAAGAVKRGLQQAGFSVQKVKGYGRKREMLTGVKA